MYVIDFAPGAVGLEGDFNTFRIGLFYSKRLTVGETVLLMDSKEKKVIGKARVLGVSLGPLNMMLDKHAARNHSQIGLSEADAPVRLREVLNRFYGPHIATDNRKTTVVHLRRIEDG